MALKFKRRIVGFALAAIFVPPGSLSALGGDFEVQIAKNVTFEEGQAFRKGDRLVLPNGASVILLDKTGPIPRSRTCVGPYDGIIDSCTKAMIGEKKFVPGGTRSLSNETNK